MSIAMDDRPSLLAELHSQGLGQGPGANAPEGHHKQRPQRLFGFCIAKVPSPGLNAIEVDKLKVMAVADQNRTNSHRLPGQAGGRLFTLKCGVDKACVPENYLHNELVVGLAGSFALSGIQRQHAHSPHSSS